MTGPFKSETATVNCPADAALPSNGALRQGRALCQEGTPSPNRGIGGTLPVRVPLVPPGNGFRDARGRFTHGNPGGPGNPFGRRVAAFRRALCDAVTPEDLQGLARSLLARARAGDHAAAALLLAYTVGRPAEAVNPDAVDVQEWRLYRQRPVGAEEIDRVLGRLPAEAACELVRRLWPVLIDGWREGVLALAADAPAPESTDGAADRPQPPDRPGH
jgi:hypothetical protein